MTQFAYEDICEIIGEFVSDSGNVLRNLQRLDRTECADSTIFLAGRFKETSDFGSAEAFVRAATHGVGIHERLRP